ncbi:ATP-binding cassette domain-containing protein [Aminobacter sp. AP02]|uniref:ATP-binding cassette domain-containing protein n=1 Tax=Aminobacter sp. AP02 TaxID=2135737 RepID=UPI000D7A4EED|nr:ATP-binding cassette domain-containing protein [Aminobacter sp. AP02]PWK59991.1 oligopeptide transport system ATP-binding protein [Aminobacter sp. AP02]
MTDVILKVEGLGKTYGGKRVFLGRVSPEKHAADNVSFELKRGESLGIVGESGSGKSTVARLITRLVEPTSGSVILGGKDFLSMRDEELRSFRQRIQMVFQDPYASLNPRKTIAQSVGGPLRERSERMSPQAINERVQRLLADVGLNPPARFACRFPKDLSGGQRQRVGIARAIAAEPDIIVADEPVSALDVSVRAQVLNLFNDLRRQKGLSYVFISHDLDVIRSVCDRVAVMQTGKVVETGDVREVLARPNHPYTQQLLASSLRPDPSMYQPRKTHEAGLATGKAGVMTGA